MLMMERDEAIDSTESTDPKETALTRERTDRMLIVLNEATADAALRLQRYE